MILRSPFTGSRPEDMRGEPAADTQPELFTQPMESNSKDVSWFEMFLLGGCCWFTAQDILLAVGRPTTDANKRWLRCLASDSGVILSGQKGYRHLVNASPEEIHHACAWLESQAKLMGDRACRLRKNAHKIFG